MSPSIYQNPQTHEIIAYIAEKYGDELEFLWRRFPSNAIWRNRVNHKWYAVLLIIPQSKLGILDREYPDKPVEILDLRFYKNEALDFAASQPNVYPGYHMNKNNWITIILDDTTSTSKIQDLIDLSYQISLRK